MAALESLPPKKKEIFPIIPFLSSRDNAIMAFPIKAYEQKREKGESKKYMQRKNCGFIFSV